MPPRYLFEQVVCRRLVKRNRRREKWLLVVHHPYTLVMDRFSMGVGPRPAVQWFTPCPRRDFTLYHQWVDRWGNEVRRKQVNVAVTWVGGRDLNRRKWESRVPDPFARETVNLVRLACRLKENRLARRSMEGRWSLGGSSCFGTGCRPQGPGFTIELLGLQGQEACHVPPAKTHK